MRTGCGAEIGEPITGGGDAGGEGSSPNIDSGKPHTDGEAKVDSGEHPSKDVGGPGEGGVCTEAQRTAIWASP